MSSKVELVWNNLSVRTKHNGTILANTSGSIAPGKIVAIMGPSGSGKSTLMNALSGRVQDSFQLEGSILVNGRERDANIWAQLVSYMPQHNEMHAFQTVYEILHFAATAKKGYSANEPEKEVNLLIKQLGLSKVRNYYFCNLSGGQQVRLGIGVEMICNTNIIFLDEPLSGLDSNSAIKVLELLQVIARNGRSVVLSVHQPSNKITDFFDEIVVMCHGSTIFHGSFQECISFFISLGFKLPANTNPADFILDSISYDHNLYNSVETYDKRMDEIKTKWMQRAPPAKPHLMDPPTKLRGSESFQTYLSLFLRGYKNIWRNSYLLISRFAQKTIIALLCGFIFFNIGSGKPYGDVIRGVITYTIFNEFFGGTANAFNRYTFEKKIIYRERIAGYYSAFAAFIALLSSEMAYSFIFEIFHLSVIYIFVNFPLIWYNFLVFISGMLGLVLFAQSYALTIGIWTEDADIAQYVGGTINVILTLFSGIFNSRKNVSFKFVTYISPITYAYETTVKSQIANKQLKNMSGDEYLKSLGFMEMSPMVSLLILILFSILNILIGTVILHHKTRPNLKTANKENNDKIEEIEKVDLIIEN